MAAVLLVGTGAVGVPAARQLLDTPGVSEVLLAGRRPQRAAELASRFGTRARAVEFRSGDPLPDGLAAVATAVPSEVDAAIAAAAVDARVPFVSSTDASSVVDALVALDRSAVEAGVPLAAGCGLAPGFADVLAADAVNALDESDELHVARAGVAGPASLLSVRRALRDPALEWYRGAWHEERRHGPELVWFPEPVGPRECEPVGSTIRLLAWAVPSVRTATFRLCEPVTRRFARVRRGPDERWGAARVVVWGRRAWRREAVVYGVVHPLADAAGTVLAVVAASVAGALPEVGTDSQERTGVRSPAELVAPVPFLAELARRGLRPVAFEGVAVRMSAAGDYERVVHEVRIETAEGPVAVRVGRLRAGAGWRGRPGSVLAATGLGLPLSVEARGVRRPVKRSGRGLGFARVLFVRGGERPARAEEEASSMVKGELEQLQSPAVYPAEQVGGALQAAASGAGAVGPVTTAGAYTVIPLTETMFSGGFGGGGGGGTSDMVDAMASVGAGGGGGGGGAGRSRTIAVAVIGPDGVEVRPVVDRTGLGLAAFTTLATIATRWLLRRRR